MLWVIYEIFKYFIHKQPSTKYAANYILAEEILHPKVYFND